MLAILEYWPVLVRGLWTTVWVALCTIAFSAIGALLIGPMRLSRLRAVRAGSMLLVEIVRGPSGLVWLFFVFYAMPMVPHMPRLSPITASVLVLSAIGTAYGSEIVRAGIQAVQRGQLDACHALGLNRLQALRKVVVPQALSQIVPAFGSLAADMVKWTSILSFVGVQDLLYVANNIRSNTFQTVAVFSMLALVYWILCLISSLSFSALERVLPLNRALRAARVQAVVPTLQEGVR